ncbi:MAG: hypothetical protein HQM04_10865 [Magnetococcales bacterium]|nr:hypothetical protein [Magnetococcales bacterium]MBF0115525.1 hypothetical protein [Magnetococcales bacterium]
MDTAPLTITRMELIREEPLLQRLRQTRLRGFGQPLVYEQARLQLRREVDPRTLYPAQNYVLQEDHRRLHTLYALFLQQGVNIFALDGALLFWLRHADGEEEGPIPLTPPVVELSQEPDGRTLPLINDGMHRVYTAMRLGLPMHIVQVEGVPPQWPYYAYPLANGWADVQELAQLPADYVKKAYRDPDNYKDLFRDFNGVFPGIQKQRKRSGLT